VAKDRRNGLGNQGLSGEEESKVKVDQKRQTGLSDQFGFLLFIFPVDIFLTAPRAVPGVLVGRRIVDALPLLAILADEVV